MQEMKSIRDIVRNGCCMSCGLCFSSMQTVFRKGQELPAVPQSEESFDFSLCPGKGYDLAEAAEEKKHSSFLLGGWESIHAVRSVSREILEKAASGGIMTSLVLKALEAGIADAAIVTKLECLDGKITVKTFAASRREELLQAQGSKYMPVPALADIRKIVQPGKKYIYIGTPCQIAGIRQLQKTDPLFRDGIVLTIGNFCGGFRDLRERDRIFRQLHIKESDVAEFAYRRGPQPGYMLIRLKSGKEYHLPYPSYSKLTGYIPLRRCRLCMDATAELADFSCGDAWIDRFRRTGQPWSILISRTERSEKILSLLKEDRTLCLETITEDEIFQAQKGNLTSKKLRQFARYRFYSLWGIRHPVFNLPEKNATAREVFFEMKVVISHSFFVFLQKIGCYPFVAKVIKRNKCQAEVFHESR